MHCLKNKIRDSPNDAISIYTIDFNNGINRKIKLILVNLIKYKPTKIFKYRSVTITLLRKRLSRVGLVASTSRVKSFFLKNLNRPLGDNITTILG